MVLSDDSSLLYVQLRGSYSIARVDLDRMKIDLNIWVAWNATATGKTRPAATIPGDPRSVLVQSGSDWTLYKDAEPVVSATFVTVSVIRSSDPMARSSSGWIRKADCGASRYRSRP
jgi:hypothetical protein